MTIILGSGPTTGILLQATTNKPGSSTITLVDGSSPTGYSLIGTPDWGNAAWDVAYSGPRGTQGARAAGATPQNRVIAFSLRVIGINKDDAFAKYSVAAQITDEWRRFGGRLTWRSRGQSYRQHFEIMSGSAAMDPWRARAEHSAIVDFTLSAVCAPYLKGDEMDILDPFDTDNGDYTLDAGAAGDLTITSGQLTSVANPTVEKRLIHTGRGYSYGDMQATVKATPGTTITSYKAGVLVNRIDASNYLEVYVDDNGTNSRLRLDKVVATVRTNLATTNLAARVIASTPFWVGGRIETNTVYLEHFTAAPTPMGTPTTSSSYALSTAEAAQFGAAALGKGGLSWLPQQASAVLDDFTVEPYTYRNATVPNEPGPSGPVPGDAPALVEVAIAPSGGAAAPIWALIGWWQRPPVYNQCWNGDFESSYLAVAGWGVAAVTNINGAATSITRTADASIFGAFVGRIVTPATADTGASFRIFRRFKRGVTYTFDVWVRAPSGATTNVYCRAGNGAANDKASSGNTALSATKQKLTVAWTPSADRDDAHITVNVSAATATTFDIDGATFYEGTVAPTYVNQSEGRGGFPPYGILEGENATGQVPTASANYRSGFAAPAASSYSWVIDPTLVVQNDYTQDEIAVEVWARGEITAGNSQQAVLLATPLTATAGFTVYSEEFGSAGRTIVMPSSGTVRRFVRLGTLRLSAGAGRYLLRYSPGPSLPGFAVDYLVLVPSSARALSPSGKRNDTNFPAFIPVTSEVTKTVKPDLSATVREPLGGAEEVRSNGLGGSLLEFPIGTVDTIVKLSSLVPDDPSSNTATEQLAHSATVHFAVTPRYILARGS